MKKILMTIALLCTLAQGAWADDVNYIYYTVNDDGKTITKHEDGTASSPTVLTSTLLEDSDEDNLKSGWYVLNSTFSYGERIVISGDVKLILKDGCTLTAEQGIRINTDAKLSIYAQSETVGTMGKLVAIETHHDKAAIGGNKNWEAGRLFIHGGEIEATCIKESSKYAAGIGGGYGDGSGMKEITIYGGKVTAQGAEGGAGIGGGKNNNHPGTINIYGGDITAEAGDYGAGIGGGQNRDGWPIIINGGKVYAHSGNCGAGIGGGYLGSGTSVVINGGRVQAYGSSGGAGIGGGCGQYYSVGDDILYVVTIGFYTDATQKGGHSGAIAIHGGIVFAEGNNYNWTVSAGIGGGIWGDVNGPITIDGGEVRVTSKTYEGDITPAIGAGLNGNCHGDITITGTANVYLYSVEDNGEENVAAHYLIGLSSCRDKAFDGTLNLSGMRVTRATTEREEKIVAANRVSVCKDEKSLWMRIMPCDHSDLTYSYINESGHTAHCKYCEYTKNEEHSIPAPSTTCEKCGYGEGSTICTLSFPQTSTAEVSGYATAGFQAVQGQAIAIPECTKVPEGWKFVGWLKRSTAPTSIEAADSETTLLQPGDKYTVTDNEMFFARYRYDFVETWMWNESLSSASLSIKAGSDEAISVTPVTVSDRTEIAATDAADGSITATATATYTHGSTTYTFSSTQTKVLSYSLSLGEDDNTEALTTYKGRSMNVTLTGRTLYKDGKWNTLCLPFSVGDGDDTDDVTFSGSPLAGATLKELTDATYNAETGTLTLTFADATSIKAGKAYLIKWDGGSNLGPSDLIFNGVTLTKDLYEDEISTDDNGTTTVTFMGTYKKISFGADDRTVLYLGADNTLYYPQSGATIGAQRAYFQLSGITAGDKAAGVRSFVIDFGDGEATGIVDAEADSSLFTLHSSLKEGWYDMQGRRLSGKPTARGIYINNGKKVVIK